MRCVNSVLYMANPIIIKDYDPLWKSTYKEEKFLISNAMGDILVAIEHIGSTAVPGLSAKPIIDIMVGVENLDSVEECIETLAGIGYDYVPEYESEIPERRYFRKGSTEKHIHLHIVELKSDFWERTILFRDYLHSHPDIADRYCELKLFLAEKFKDEIELYTSGKTGFIKSVVKLAREELMEDIDYEDE